jgi:hypothetical protein
MRRWVCNADMPGLLVADEISIGTTFTSVAAARLCKVVTEKVVMGLPLSIIGGDTVEEWVMLAQNDFPGIDGEAREWYPLQTLNSGLHRMLEIQPTPPHRHPTLVSAHEPFLVVIMPSVAEMFKTVINEMTYGTELKLVNLLPDGNANFPHPDLNTSIDKPESRWNIHLVSYDTLSSRAKPSCNGQLSY